MSVQMAQIDANDPDQKSRCGFQALLSANWLNRGGNATQGCGVTPPTPQWPALGTGSAKLPMATATYAGKAFALPVDGGAACRTEIKGQRVSALGFPAPRRSLTGEGDLLAWKHTHLLITARSGADTQGVAHGTRDDAPSNSRRSCPQLQAARRVIIALLHGYR